MTTHKTLFLQKSETSAYKLESNTQGRKVQGRKAAELTREH